MNRVKKTIQDAAELWRSGSLNCPNHGNGRSFPNMCLHGYHGKEHPICSVANCPYWNGE